MKPSQLWPNQHLKSDTQIKAELRQVKPDDWLIMIKAFSEPLRTRLANLIWWDFCGERIGTERWHNLDLYLNAPHVDCDVDELKKALMYCGYSEQMATARVKPNIFLPVMRRGEAV